MRAAPTGIQTSAVVDMLRAGWGFEAVTAEYTAVGAGSYHWVVADADGRRRFVTVDDLDAKAWLGDTREERLDGLRAAFATAASLRAGGLVRVVAPQSALDGEPLRRLDERHTVALFPLVEGEPGEWGPFDEDGRRAVVGLLAELHAADPAAAATLRTAGLELPGRHHLEAALRDREVEWSGGPLAEPTRAAIRSAATEIAELLALSDRLAAEAGASGGSWVVTHGEPHRGNVMRTAAGHVLVDWDTVALAPPERDLWFVVEDGTDSAERYEAATGRAVDAGAIDFFRVTWDLKDLAEYLNVLRAPHEENEDMLAWYGAVTRTPEVYERWSALLR
jgi:Ser/Thr protein kinase RdoA (MazF antagonist)